MSLGRRWAMVMVALASALCCEPAAAAPGEPENLLLRLSDMPPGYMVGDDTGCGFGVAEEAPEVLEQLAREHPAIGCGIDLERRWVTPGDEPGPALVESAVYAFESPAGAAAGFDVPALIPSTLGVAEDSLTEFPLPGTLGDEARMFHTDDALVRGRPRRPGTVVVWRSGPLLAFMLTGGPAGGAQAFALALTQQGRMAVPTPIPPGENDSRLVPLGDPDLDIPVYWLGEAFDPPGALPKLTIGEVFAPVPRRDGLGRAHLSYAGGRTGASIILWRRVQFRAFRRTAVGRLVLSRSCVRAGRVDLPLGDGVVHTDRCGRSHEDFTWAHTTIGRTVVTVNLPICMRCIDRRQGRRRGYATRAGLVTLLRRLERRR